MRATSISLVTALVLLGSVGITLIDSAALSAIPAKIPSVQKEESMFQVKSNAFPAEGNIPPRYTCEGENISPELNWSGAPQGTKSFALVLHDPDAPKKGGYTHWVVFNIPGSETQIAENGPKQARLPGGGTQGRNDSGALGYTGPCPPSGTHRYIFHLYALDQELNLKEGASKEELEKALGKHVLGRTEVMGKYKKGAGKAA